MGGGRAQAGPGARRAAARPAAAQGARGEDRPVTHPPRARALGRASLSRRQLLTALGGAPGPERAAAAGPGAPPHLPLWRSREEPGDGGYGGLEWGGQETRMCRVTEKGEGECQEVRAPRTCPAVRMRRAAAAQGKASTILSALLPHPQERGGARPETGGQARGADSQGARSRRARPRPPLKGQHLRGRLRPDG